MRGPGLLHQRCSKRKPEKKKKKKKGNEKNKVVCQGGIVHTGLRPPFRFWVWVVSWVKGSASASGVDTVELMEPSGKGSDLGTTGSMTVSLCSGWEAVSTIETIGAQQARSRYQKIGLVFFRLIEPPQDTSTKPSLSLSNES
jgi:hypothetical protein